MERARTRHDEEKQDAYQEYVHEVAEIFHLTEHEADAVVQVLGDEKTVTGEVLEQALKDFVYDGPRTGARLVAVLRRHIEGRTWN